MFSFNLILTELCNAKCSHCYMSDDNKSLKKTIDYKDLECIINKFPADTKTVVFTGGEVFLKKDLLYFAVKKTHELNQNIEIGIESNGIFLYNNINNATKELENLKNLGVSFIRFSDDEFHFQGGVDLERVRKLKVLESNKTPVIKFLCQNDAVAFGKAKSLPKTKIAIKNCMNNTKTVCDPYLFLDVNGNVFICTWKCAPSIGNLINESFETVKNRLTDDFNRLILSGKIEDAIDLKFGESNDDLNFSKQFGQCMLCNKYFNTED